MRKGRKPISETNMKAVIVLSIIFALLFGALTEDLIILIACAASIPLVILLVFFLWFKFGHNGIQLNSINVFVMLTMFAVYSSIPLFSVIWGTWLSWLIIIIHFTTYLIGYINRERFALILNSKNRKGEDVYSKFLVSYALGVFFIGIASIIILNFSILIDADYLLFYGFIYLLAYYTSAISPAFLINPQRALELGVVTQEHYDTYY